MKRTFLLCAALLTALPLTLLAKDFPLEFKSLTAPDGLSLPGGGGISGSLQLEKPGAITREPPAESRHPLYGQLSDQTNRLWFRLDESGGTGKSYDRLIMDLNQNGDLTDDAVAMRADKPAPTITTNNERSVFGPIPVPAEMKIGSWRPIYFAQLYLYNLSLALQSGSRRTYIGQLRLRPGWYLETTVELDGMRRKVGIVDSDCSFRLGETSRPQTYESNGEKNWYFAGGDSFLIDSDNSGNFKGSAGNDESAPFGSLLYLGAKPYKVVLAADDKSLAVEPWKGPLAELVLQPHGEQVSAIEVAWESAPDQWQLLQPGVENGKARVPPGSYRLIDCTLKVPAANGTEVLILEGYKRAPDGTVKVEAGGSAPFKCGSPLEIKVASERETRVVLPQALIADGKAPLQQRIEASVLGAGGETYSSFYLENKGKTHQPPSPAFTVVTADGKEVGSGNMEFG